MERICSKPDCDTRHHSRGLCEKHYRKARYQPRQRQYPQASPQRPLRPRVVKPSLRVTDPKAFIRTKITVDDLGCWLWQGRIDARTGYGYVSVKKPEPPRPQIRVRSTPRTHP